MGRPLVDDRMSVRLTLGTHMVEARVAPACHLSLLGIDLIEVPDDRLDRGTQAVEVKPIEAGLGSRVGLSVVAGPQPLHEAQHIPVSPHPGGKAAEAPQRGISILVGRHAHHIPVDSVGVWPIPLDGDDRKAELVDQAPGDAGRSR